MDKKLVKNKLLNLSEKNDRSEYESLSKSDYVSMFHSISDYFPYTNRQLKIAVSKFLYYGADKFNKFSIPTPYNTSNEDFITFKKFLDALCLQEGENSVNTPVLKLHKIKWEIYNDYNFSKLNSSTLSHLSVMSNQVEEIDIPTECGSDKLVEFNKQKSELLSLISGLLSNSLFTKIRTRLPYRFARNTSISFKINQIDFAVKISPHYIGNMDTFWSVNDGAIMENVGASKWQNSISEIEIVINCLIDDSKVEAPLIIASHNDSATTENWNFLYKITYDIIEKVWWHFIDKDIATSSWCPVPKDIPFIEFSQWHNEEQLEFKLTSNPSNIHSIHQNNDEEENYVFDSLEEVAWTKKCFLYAKISLEIGQFKEALFWLNVATESLLEDFICFIVKEEDVREELLKGVSTFASAEEILSKQFPEMKGRVQWPKSTKHPSVFNKLKQVFKLAKTDLSEKEVLKKYSIISSDRNFLFHGSNIDLQSEKIKKAFEAYDWLTRNLFK